VDLPCYSGISAGGLGRWPSEEAGIPEGVCMDILGHDKNDHMSYGRYSGTVSLKVKTAAIEKLPYPG
jgi:hypothetical protein